MRPSPPHGVALEGRADGDQFLDQTFSTKNLLVCTCHLATAGTTVVAFFRLAHDMYALHTRGAHQTYSSFRAFQPNPAMAATAFNFRRTSIFVGLRAAPHSRVNTCNRPKNQRPRFENEFEQMTSGCCWLCCSSRRVRECCV